MSESFTTIYKSQFQMGNLKLNLFCIHNCCVIKLKYFNDYFSKMYLNLMGVYYSNFFYFHGKMKFIILVRQVFKIKPKSFLIVIYIFIVI